MFGVSPGQPIIALEGTIETIYNRISYATPIGIYLPPTYPTLPPTAKLLPTSDMVIIESMNVNRAGFITLPYLTSWNSEMNNIVDLLVYLSSIFSQHAPLRKVSTLPPNNYPMNNNNNYPMNNHPGGYGGMGMMNPGNMYYPNNNLNYNPGSVGLPAPLPGRGYPMGLTPQQNSSTPAIVPGTTATVPGTPTTTTTSRPPLPPNPQLTRMSSDTAVEDSFREELTRRLKDELQKKFTEMRDNIDNWNVAREQLLQREKALKNSIAALKARTEALRKYKANAQETIKASQDWLDIWDPKPFVGNSTNTNSNTNAKQNDDDVQSVRTGSSYGANSNPGRSVVSGPNGVASSQMKYSNAGGNNTSGLYLPNGMRLDDFVVPATVLQSQLLDAIAEDNAIEDLYTWVVSSADKGQIRSDTLVKEIRDLARRQFRARYMARKIDAALTEEVRQRLNLQSQYGTNNGGNRNNNQLPPVYPNINNTSNGYPGWSNYPGTK